MPLKAVNTQSRSLAGQKGCSLKAWSMSDGGFRSFVYVGRQKKANERSVVLWNVAAFKRGGPMRHVSWFRHPERLSGLRACCLILVSSVLILPDAWAQSGAWVKKTTLPTLRGALSACVIGQKIYAVGGVTAYPLTDLAANEVYDLNPWTVKSPLPTPRGWLFGAVVNDTIYVMGGGYPTATRKVEAYNPVTDTWTAKADMLGSRRAAQAGVVNGIIYVIGGNETERNCEAYDPASNTWTRKSDRPESGGWLAVTVYNGLVYTFGGGNTGNAQKNVYAYDPQTDTWTKKADMPTARNAFQTYLVGGKIYAIGGTGMMSNALKTVEEYDPVANTWKTLGDMPVALAWFGGAVANNKIYVISGSPDGGYTGTGDIWEYDPAMTSGAWVKKTTLPTLRGALFSCVIGQKLYTVGGVTAYPWTDLAANEVYDLNPWAVKLPMPTARGWLSGAVVNDTIYAIGGGYPNATRKVEAYNPVTNTWTAKADMLRERRAAQAGVVNGIIYNIGGNQSERNCEAYNPVTNEWLRKTDRPESGGDLAVTVYNGLVYTFGGGYTGTAQKNVYAYDPQTDTWTKKADMPTARFGFQTYLVGGKIYAIGGTQMMSDALKTVEEYDPVANTWKTLGDMPVALAWFGGVVANNKIYVISGSPDGGYTGTGDIWEYDPAMTGVTPGVETSLELPGSFMLEQNYPNPFNPTTVIRYLLPASVSVTLTVYDLLGREVTTLVNERMNAGVHEATFSGSGLSSGVYFYRLSAGDFVQTKRLMVLR